jgi:hypothetical protein
MDDDTKAQCVVRLGDGEFRVSDKPQSHHFFVPLTSHGLPYLDRTNKPVQAGFTIELTTFPANSMGADAMAALMPVCLPFS